MLAPWVIDEVSTADLKDKRLKKRLAQVLSDLAERCPATQLVSVADSEADIYEFLVEATTEPRRRRVHARSLEYHGWSFPWHTARGSFRRTPANAAGVCRSIAARRCHCDLAAWRSSTHPDRLAPSCENARCGGSASASWASPAARKGPARSVSRQVPSRPPPSATSGPSGHPSPYSTNLEEKGAGTFCSEDSAK
mgnify:CR=1 FL=1